MLHIFRTALSEAGSSPRSYFSFGADDDACRIRRTSMLLSALLPKVESNRERVALFSAVASSSRRSALRALSGVLCEPRRASIDIAAALLRAPFRDGAAIATVSKLLLASKDHGDDLHVLSRACANVAREIYAAAKFSSSSEEVRLDASLHAMLSVHIESIAVISNVDANVVAANVLLIIWGSKALDGATIGNFLRAVALSPPSKMLLSFRAVRELFCRCCVGDPPRLLPLCCAIYAKLMSQLSTSERASAGNILNGALSVERPVVGAAGATILDCLWMCLRSGQGVPSDSLRSVTLDATAHTLILVDFDHLVSYGDCGLFARTGLHGMAIFLRDYLYEQIWQGDVAPSSHDIGPLASAVRLFQQLYDIDCRHSFMLDASDWLFPRRVTTQQMRMAGAGVAGDVTLNVNQRGQFTLENIPQCVRFEDRVELFHALLAESKGDSFAGLRSSSGSIRVSRDSIVEDSFDQLASMTSTQLKGRIQVSFISETGLEEAGIDGGGLFKEYIISLMKAVFDPGFALFKETEGGSFVYPSPGARIAVDDHLRLFHFVGRMVGKAVYEGILMETRFALFFLNACIGRYNTLHDLESLDAELHKNLMMLKAMSNVEDLCLTFSITSNEYGKATTSELIPGGSDVHVTSANAIEYVHRVADYRLNVELSEPVRAFVSGLADIIPSLWLRMFQPRELQSLICGSDEKFSVADLRASATYGGGYHPSQPYVQWFWQVLEELTKEQAADFLMFVTSCSRAPLRGFATLNPKFCIFQVRIAADADRLPSASTCVNLLKLPKYSSKDVLRQKLLYSISSKSGFELS